MADNRAPLRQVPYVNLPAQFAEQRADIMKIVDEVFGDGHFVGGEAIERFEDEIARYCGVEHAIAVNSGTDALRLAMLVAGVGPGDEVITPPNSFIASTSTIVHLGARPVFVDVRADQNIDPGAIAAAITPRTKAIMPVHLTGRIADMNPILEIASKHGLVVIEDAAQAIASKYDGRMSGSLGDFGCFSAHPLKNLNACGDAGFITTNNGAAAERIHRLRNQGMANRDTVVEWGYVSRMDALKAAILLLRLRRLESVIERRRRIAQVYRSSLAPAHVFYPPCRNIEYNTFHTFIIQVDRRQALQAFLSHRGIGSAVHYPLPIHLQPAARELGYHKGDFPVAERQAGRVLSLPVHQFLSDEDVAYVAQTVNAFYQAVAA